MNEDFRVLTFFHQISEKGGPRHFLKPFKNYANNLKIDEKEFYLKMRSLEADGFIEPVQGTAIEGNFKLTKEGRSRAKEYLEFRAKEEKGFIKNNWEYIKRKWGENKHKVLWWLIIGIWSAMLFFSGKYFDSLFK